MYDKSDLNGIENMFYNILRLNNFHRNLIEVASEVWISPNVNVSSVFFLSIFAAFEQFSLSLSLGNSTLCFFVLVFPLHAIKVFNPYFLISKLFLTRRLCNLSQPKVASLWYFLMHVRFIWKDRMEDPLSPRNLLRKSTDL